MTWDVTLPKPGDIIRTKVTFYYHYGIFVSETEVIQFGLPDNINRPACEVQVLATSIADFLTGSDVEVMLPDKQDRKAMRSAKEIIKTARSKIGEGGYHVFENNCEHFVYACAFKSEKNPKWP